METPSLPIYNFSEKRLRNNLENALDMGRHGGSHSPLILPDQTTSSACLEMAPNSPQPLEKLSFLKASTALPGPSRVHSHISGRAKGHSSRQVSPSFGARVRSRLSGPEEEAEMWLRQGEWSQAQVEGPTRSPPASSRGSMCTRGLCTQGSGR